MADREVDFLLIGGGVASAACAAELRKRGAEGSILVVGREPDAPYERPPLSKEYLRGDAGREDSLMQAADWYEENDVELLTAKSVMGIDLETRTAKLQGKEEVTFGKALFGTGAMVNILRIEGSRLQGIHYLRAFGNADKIRDDVAAAERVVLIGGSYIGCEVAASLTEMGKQCEIVMMEDVALSNTFGDEAGRYFHELLESKGIVLHPGESLAEFIGDERVSGVRTESGKEILGDAVIVGAGVKPDVMLAERAGLDVDDGIICDSGLETSAEGIFAAGDCCNYDSAVHGQRIRVEHHDVAFQQGKHAAAGMLGEKEPYRVVPYFFSDLSDWASMEYVGPAYEWDEVVFRGETSSGEFSAWYLKDGAVKGALSVGRGEDLPVASSLIDSGRSVDRAALEDTENDLAELAG